MFEISYLAINLFSTYIVLFAYSRILGRQKTGKLIYLLSFLSYFVISSIVYLLFDNPLCNIASNIIILFLITFNYNVSIKKRIIVTFSFYVFVAVIESIVVMIYNLLHLSPHSRTDPVSIIWGMAIANIITFLSCVVFLRKINLRQNSKMNIKQILSICIVSIGILILTYVLITIYYENMVLVLISIITLSIICIFVFNFINITLKVQIEEQQKKHFELQSKSYLNELKIINKSQEEIRCIKHDMINYLNTIQALADTKNYLKIKTLIKSIAGTLKNTERISNTNVTELDSIINFKINTAKNNGIQVNTNIQVEKEIKIEPQDYISIISNIFDNAIEAVKNIKSDNKYIDFSIGIITSLLIIRIENPYDHTVLNSDNKLITTKQNKNQHGYGLLHVYSIVNKYNGTINISYNNNFLVEISIFNK